MSCTTLSDGRGTRMSGYVGKGSVQNLFPLQTSPEEPFEDLNGDRTWQEGEPFTDRNGNEIYDPGAHIKLTVAKYYLPSGRCPHLSLIHI